MIVDPALGFMKSLPTILNDWGFLPSNLIKEGLTFWDWFGVTFLMLFAIGGVICTAWLLYFISQEFFEEHTGLSYMDVFRFIRQKKLIDYYKKRKLAAGDIVAFRFDTVVILLKVTDNWKNDHLIIATPLKSVASDELTKHYISVLAELKKNFSYEEISILDKKTLMRILYGR